MEAPHLLISGTKEIQVENTEERISSTSVEIVACIVRAQKANAANVHIGPGLEVESGERVGTNSYELEPSESLEFNFLDLSRVFIYGKKGDKVQFVGLRP